MFKDEQDGWAGHVSVVFQNETTGVELPLAEFKRVLHGKKYFCPSGMDDKVIKVLQLDLIPLEEFGDVLSDVLVQNLGNRWRENDAEPCLAKLPSHEIEGVGPQRAHAIHHVDSLLWTGVSTDQNSSGSICKKGRGHKVAFPIIGELEGER